MLKRCSLIALIAAIITFGFATRSQADVGNWIANNADCIEFLGGPIMFIYGGPEDGMASLSVTTYTASGSVFKTSVVTQSMVNPTYITGYPTGGGVKVIDNNNGGNAFTCGNVPASAAGATTGSSGPAIPKNKDGSVYEQKYIACTMSVFDAPGGNAINGASVKEGQVFYAGKDTKEDADGKSWTPIFVSSGTPVWILTSCVK